MMARPPKTLLDLNSASEEDLTHKLKLTPRLAKRVILMRPYARIEDLGKVWGMDADTLHRILPLVVLPSNGELSPRLEPSLPDSVTSSPQTISDTPTPVIIQVVQPVTTGVESRLKAAEEAKRVSRIWPKKVILSLLAILLVGACFRFVGLNWDQNQHQHPDERFLTMVAERIQPVSIGGYFDTATSTLNPLQNGASYTYGMFPLFVTRAVAQWVDMTQYDKIVLVGRVMSGLFDLTAVLLLYILGATLFNRRVGLLAAALAAAAVLPIQLSHFFTVDSFSTVLILAAFYFTYRAVPILTPRTRPKWKDLPFYALFGLMVGLAMASKINTAPLFGILVVASLAYGATTWKSRRERAETWKVVLVGVFTAALVTAVTFRIFQPYAFLGPGFFGLQLNPRWLSIMKEVTNQVAGKSEWPPNHHWTSRPALYAWTNMVSWGMGLPLGLAAWFGLAWAAWRAFKGDWRRQILPVIWVVSYFIWQNIQFWRYMRYFLPIYPILILLAAWALIDWLDRTRPSWERCNEAFRNRKPKLWPWKQMLPGLAVVLSLIAVVWGTYLYAYSFARIYVQPLTRVAASRWMLQNIAGPVNVTVGTQSYPIAAPSSFAFYTGDSYQSAFTPLTAAEASAITTDRINIATGDFRIKISQDPDGKEILTDGHLVVRTDNTADKLVVPFGEVNLEAGKTYSVIYTLRTSGSMKADQVYLRGDKNEDPHVPIQWTPSIQEPGVEQGHIEFTPSADQTINRLVFEGFQGTYQPAPVTLEFTLSKGSGGEDVLATTQATNTFDAEENPQSPAFHFTPVKLDARTTYYLSYKVISGGPIVFSAEQFTLETSWDDSLPLRVDGYDPLGGIYAPLNLELYDPDTIEKRERMVNILEKTNYIVLPSNRSLDAMPRLPLRYPMTLKYYQALFDCACNGDGIEAKAAQLRAPFHSPLGFDLVATFESDPGIGPFSVSDQLADESFTVYDHPKVLIFKKSADFSNTKLRSLLGSVDLTQVVDQAPLAVSKNPTNYRMPADRLAAQVAGGTWSALYNLQSIINNNQAVGALVWYLTILLLGLLSFPMVFLVFRSLPDRGYPFGRLISLLAIAWFVWMVASLKIVPFVQGLLWSGVVIFTLVNLWLARRNWSEIRDFVMDRWRYLLMVEGLFAALFLFNLMLRLGNPDLWQPWMGGEKPMDFAIFNSVLKSVYFPPENPWFAGNYLNYYYYGYVLAAIPTRLLGIQPSIAYNLILPTWFALIGVGIFSVVHNLVGCLMPAVFHRATSAPGESQNARLRRYPFIAGISAVILMLFLGNLFQVGQLWKFLPEAANQGQPVNSTGLARLGPVLSGAVQVISGSAQLPGPKNRWYFEASRPILHQGPDTPISEFPYFTFLYGDMHPHMLTMPVMFAALAWVLNLFLGAGKRKSLGWLVGTLLLGGLILGMFRAGHTWDYPTFLGLAVLAIGWVAWKDHESLSTKLILSFMGGAVLLGVLTILMYYPFGEWFATAYSSVEWWQGLRTPLGDYLSVHGLFLFLIVSYLTWESFPWLRKRFLQWKSHPFAWLAFDPESTFRIAVFIGIVLGLGLLWINDLQVFVLVIPLLVWIAIRLFQKDQPALKQLLLVFFALTLLVTLLVEVVVLTGDVGRSNMVFYFYIQVWTFFSVGASAAFVLMLEHSRKWKQGWRWTWMASLAILVLGAAAYPITATQARLSDRWPNVTTPPRTLDGMAYMLGDSATSGDPAASAVYDDSSRLFTLATDYAGIHAMQAGVSGTPTIVEGQTEEYRWGSRYSIYTGLPTVVGWSWHVRQHNSLMDGAIVEKRIAEVKDFYSTTDLNSTLSFLRRYQVKYIILGDLERAYYPGDGLNKFALLTQNGSIQEFFKKDLGSSHLVIYKVLNIQ